MKTINIILADDHSLFRDGLKSILSDCKHIKIIAEASSGTELLEILKDIRPNLLILDISFPDISGIELTKIIVENYPLIPVLILSMHNNEEFILNSIKAGAKGYLSKDTSSRELLEAISRISEGNEFFNKNISDIMLKGLIERTKIESKPQKKKIELTSRELEIVKFVSQGLINKEIAEILSISIRTVDAHKNNILQKLELKSSIEIVKYAIKNNIIEL